MAVIPFDEYQRLAADVAKIGTQASVDALAKLQGNTVAPKSTTTTSTGSNGSTPPSSLSSLDTSGLNLSVFKPPSPTTTQPSGSVSSPPASNSNPFGGSGLGASFPGASTPTTPSGGGGGSPSSVGIGGGSGAIPNSSQPQFKKEANGSITGQLTPDQLAVLRSLPPDQQGSYLNGLYKQSGIDINAPAGGGGGIPAANVGKITFGGQNYEYNPTNYTKPAWLDSMNENQQMAVFQQDPNLGRLEMNRAYQVYLSNKDPNALAWINKIRRTMNLPAWDGASPLDMSTPQQQQQQLQDPKDATAELWKKLMDTVNAMNNQNNAKWQQEQEIAKQQAAQIFNQKKSNYTDLIDSLKTQQGNELSSLQNDLSAERMNIEDRNFQNWLAARQDAASRGLGSSGIGGGDADTRAILARQRDLAGLYNTNLKNVNSINQRYGSQLATAQSQLANLSQSDLERQAFADLYKAGSSSLGDQAKIFADLLGKSFGYSYTKPADLLKYDTDLKKIGFDYDKLDATSKQFYDKLDADNAYRVAKLSQDYNINMTKIMGVDANGNPTLDAQQLMETMRHNQSSEMITVAHNSATEAIGRMNAATSAENARLRGEELQSTIDNRVANLQLEAEKLKNTNFDQQANDILSTARIAQGKMANLVRQKADYMDSFKNDTSKIDQTKLANFDRDIKIAADEIDAATNSVLVMRKLKDPSAQPLNGGLTSNSGGR